MKNFIVSLLTISSLFAGVNVVSKEKKTLYKTISDEFGHICRRIDYLVGKEKLLLDPLVFYVLFKPKNEEELNKIFDPKYKSKYSPKLKKVFDYRFNRFFGYQKADSSYKRELDNKRRFLWSYFLRRFYNEDSLYRKRLKKIVKFIINKDIDPCRSFGRFYFRPCFVSKYLKTKDLKDILKTYYGIE